MARHRNVRTMNYEDEYYDEDDVYGHSVEDNYCISPGTAAQFTYNREGNVALSNFMGEHEGIPEEDEEDDAGEVTPGHQHRSSLDYTRPKLADVDEAKLNSVLEEVRNVLGEAVPEGVMVDTIMRHNFSVEGSLNELLNTQEPPKPQREPRKDRRNRSQELDDEIDNDNSPDLTDDIFSNIAQNKGGVMKFGDSVSPQSPSFMFQSKGLSKSLMTDSVVVNQHCATVPRTVKSDITAPKIGGGRKLNRDIDTQHNLNAFNQNFTSNTNSGDGDITKEKSKEANMPDIKQSLSALAEQNKKATTSLSDLAKEHCKSSIHTVNKPSQPLSSDSPDCHEHNFMLKNTLPADNSASKLNMESKISDIKLSSSLSSLAKARISKTQVSVSVPRNAGTGGCISQMPSLSGSASLPLSQLATAHLKNASPLSHLAKAHSDNVSPLTKLSKANLSNSSALLGLAKAHSGNSLPLLELAKDTSGKSSPMAGLQDNKLHSIKTSAQSQSANKLSLSQLAEAHGVKKLPLSNSEKENHGVFKQNPSRPSSEMIKNKSDKEQIMLSLSSMIDKKDKIDKKDRVIVTRQSASSARKVSEKDEEKHIVTKRIAESDIERGTVSSAKSKTVSLADLARKKDQQIPRDDIVNTQQDIVRKSHETETGNTETFVSKSEFVSADTKVEPEDIDMSKRKFTVSDDSQLKNLKHYVRGPSDVGYTLCLEARVRCNVNTKKKYKLKKFSYKNQMKGLRESLIVNMNKIKPFDFNSPSPDDVVKQMQKQAFSRCGK